MTPIGHTITGLTIGLSAMPDSMSRKKTGWFLILFVAIANLPDWPIPYWGHDQYRISHSVFVNLLLFFLIGWFGGKWIRKIAPSLSLRKILFFIGLAWGSHFLLDSFYNHGLGVMIWWPFSDHSLSLPIPWFSVQQTPLFPIHPETLKIWGIECLSYGPIMLFVLLWKVCVRKKNAFRGNYRGK